MADFVAASNSDEDKPVPVEVKMVVWVKRRGYEAEYSIDPVSEGNDYNFEDTIQDWVVDEMQNYGIVNGNWDNVTEVTS